MSLKKTSGDVARIAPSGDYNVEVSHVGKEYRMPTGCRKIIEDVTFSLAEGQFVGLVGPTGCGKTTLLKIIAGFEVASAGVVSVGGKPVRRPGPDRGFVFQQPNLFPWLSVFDNVAFSIKHGRDLVRPVPRDALKSRVEEYLTAVGLGPARDLRPHQISGGMKARAALARVFATGAPILLLDEPFAALDALTRSAMHKLLLELRNRGVLRTAILITHDVEEAIVLSDRILVMGGRPGRIVGKVDIPFSVERDYGEIATSAEVVSMKAEVLKYLSPFLEE